MKLAILRRRALYLLCFLILLYFPETTSAQEKSPTYAITHAKIFTVSGAAIDDGTVVIQNGKIANVGAAVDVPAGAQVIDDPAVGIGIDAHVDERVLGERLGPLVKPSANVMEIAKAEGELFQTVDVRSVLERHLDRAAHVLGGFC